MNVAVDPEVREIVDEVLCDSESTLSRMPERGMGGWLTRVETASAGEPWLSKAEKHLLRAHRESVAGLLYQACQAQALKDRNAGVVCRNLTPVVAMNLADPNTLESRVEEELALKHRDPTSAKASALLSHARQKVTGSSLGLLSLRLVPRDETRLWLGLCLLNESNHASAQRCFEMVLLGRPKPLNHALALVNLGLIALLNRRFASGFTYYRRARRAQEDVLVALTGLMYCSLMIGNRRELLDSARELDDIISIEHAAVEELSAATAQIAHLTGSASACKAMFEAERKRLPPIAQSVLASKREAYE